MRRRLKWAVLILVILVGVVWVWRYRAGRAAAKAEKSARVVKVERGEVTEKITEKGRVVAAKSESVGVPLGAVLSRVLAEEGQRVEKGAVLGEVTYRNQGGAAEAIAEVPLPMAAGALREGAGKLRALVQEGSTENRAVVEALRKAAAAAEELASVAVPPGARAATGSPQSGAEGRETGGPEELPPEVKDRMEKAAAAMREALRNLRRASEGAEKVQGVLAELEDVLGEVPGGEGRRAPARSEGRRELVERLTAPISGTVVEVPGRPEGAQGGARPARQLRMQVGQEFTIADLSTLEVEVNFDEVDVVKVKEGAAAVLRFDALPGQEFAATVKRVAPAAAEGQDLTGLAYEMAGGASAAVWYAVRLGLAKQEGRLRPGMTAEVEIVVETKEGALWLPPQAIEESGGKAWVMVGSAPPGERRAVKVGLRTARQVEIVEGLREGETVVIPAGRYKERRREAFPDFF